jgi:hypothetical protein
MSGQMDLLYLTATGHVLSAFTRAGEPKNLEKTATTFSGDSLLINGLGDPTAANFNSRPNFVVPGEQVSLFRKELDPGLLAQPRNLCLINLPSSPTLQTTRANPPSPSGTPPSTISLPAGETASTDLQVVILVEGQNLTEPVLLPSKIVGGQSSVSVIFPTLAPGNYFAVFLVATYPIIVAPFSVP